MPLGPNLVVAYIKLSFVTPHSPRTHPRALKKGLFASPGVSPFRFNTMSIKAPLHSFNAMDTDHSGTVDADEFIRWALRDSLVNGGALERLLARWPR